MLICIGDRIRDSLIDSDIYIDQKGMKKSPFKVSEIICY